MFWKTIKPFLSDKMVSSEKITSVDNTEIITGDVKYHPVLNIFSNIVNNLTIHQYSISDLLSDNTAHSIIKCIV